MSEEQDYTHVNRRPVNMDDKGKTDDMVFSHIDTSFNTETFSKDAISNDNAANFEPRVVHYIHTASHSFAPVHTPVEDSSIPIKMGYHRQITLPIHDRNPFWQRVRALDKLGVALKALQKSGELSPAWQAFASQLEAILSDEHVKELIDEPPTQEG